MAVYDPPRQLVRGEYFNVVNMFPRDRGGVTGDDELILDSHSSRASARAGRVSVTTVKIII